MYSPSYEAEKKYYNICIQEAISIFYLVYLVKLQSHTNYIKNKYDCQEKFFGSFETMLKIMLDI